MSPYLKFFVALLGAVLTAAAGALPTGGHFTQATLVNVVLAVLGALAVYVGPNVHGAPGWLAGGYTKVLLAALTAVATAIASFIAAHGSLAGITSVEIVQIVFAALSALGVGLLPNARPAHARGALQT
jgi:hypothetical protein